MERRHLSIRPEIFGINQQIIWGCGEELPTFSNAIKSAAAFQAIIIKNGV